MKDSMYHDYKVGEYVYTPDGQLRKITRVTSLSIILENLGNIGIHTILWNSNIKNIRKHSHNTTSNI